MSDGDYTCARCETKYGPYKALWDPNARECVHECPDDTPVAGASKVCMTCAEANKSAPFWNPVTRECVKECPEGRNGSVCTSCADDNAERQYWDGASCKSCAEAFPDQKLYWDPYERDCVPECTVSVANEVLRLCDFCSNRKFWNGFECIDCPAWLPNWDT